MPHDERLREHPLQLAHERQKARLLFQRARVLGTPPAVQSALVADAYAVAVVVAAVRPHLFQRSSAVDVAVAGDVEVIADVLESPVADVVEVLNELFSKVEVLFTIYEKIKQACKEE